VLDSDTHKLRQAKDRPVDSTTRLPVDLAGHTITIAFVGSRAYFNTHIRLKNVMLLRQ